MSLIEIAIRGYLTANGRGRTWQLARRYGYKTAQMRRILSDLERKGVVRKNERYSYVNDFCWELVKH